MVFARREDRAIAAILASLGYDARQLLDLVKLLARLYDARQLLDLVTLGA